MNYNYYNLKERTKETLRVYIAIDFEDNIKNYFDKITSHIKNIVLKAALQKKITSI